TGVSSASGYAACPITFSPIQSPDGVTAFSDTESCSDSGTDGNGNPFSGSASISMSFSHTLNGAELQSVSASETVTSSELNAGASGDYALYFTIATTMQVSINASFTGPACNDGHGIGLNEFSPSRFNIINTHSAVNQTLLLTPATYDLGISASTNPASSGCLTTNDDFSLFVSFGTSPTPTPTPVTPTPTPTQPVSFDWSVPARFDGLDHNGDGLPDYFGPDGSLVISPSRWRVDFTYTVGNACPA